MLQLFSKLFDSNEKQIKKLQPQIDLIDKFGLEYQELTDEQLKGKTIEFRKRLGVNLETARTEEFDVDLQKAKLMEILPEAFALVREAADRVAQHRHFDVQLLAGYFLANNSITELFTGEGKTNAATLAMYLYGLTGRGAHLITVNDYLARRDGEWNGHVLGFLGLTVGVVNSGQQYVYIPDDEVVAVKGEDAVEGIKNRKEMQKKVGRLKLDMMDSLNLRESTKHETYACDVVYGTNNEFGFDYLRDNMAQRIADRVQSRLHFAIVDEADSILIDEARTPLIISQSAQASNELYKKFAQVARQLRPEEHYTVDEKSKAVAISDEGIDAVEKFLNVDNVYEDPNFAYHLENALKAKELYKIDDEYIIRNGEIVIVDEFTGRALAGRRYSEGLHQAIEAKENVEVKRESKTLATITLQNYFRLYNYMAGMTATALTEAEEFSKVYKLDVVVVPTNRPVKRIDDNDIVYRTEMAKFRAIVGDIIEAYHRKQPVLVGTTSVEKSELISMMLEKEGIPHEVLNAKHHEREAKIVQDAGKPAQITIATNMAGRGTDIALGDGVKELGGLLVIGTERHESRRIDNQLRGRSGRQGDPGKSRFFVSFEDELMRLFGGDRMKSIMTRVGMDDDMPISIGILGRTIENAQKKVESNNFDIRKRLVDYDDVLNQQREVVYGLRRKLLSLVEEVSSQDRANVEFKVTKEDLKELDIDRLLDELDAFTLKNTESWNLLSLDSFEFLKNPVFMWILKRFVDNTRILIASQLSDDMKIDNIEERKTMMQVRSLVTDELEAKAAKALGYKSFIEMVREYNPAVDKPLDLENLIHRFLVTSFVIHIAEIGDLYASEMSRMLVLQTIDYYWMEHLDGMADLREGIGMQSMAQRDPLVAYKNEGFILFEKMLADIDSAVINRFMKVRIVKETNAISNADTSHPGADAMLNNRGRLPMPPGFQRQDERPGQMTKQATIVNESYKIGRNDHCPCGSGKKYKKCHLDKEPSSKEERDAFNLYFQDRKAWETKFPV